MVLQKGKEERRNIKCQIFQHFELGQNVVGVKMEWALVLHRSVSFCGLENGVVVVLGLGDVAIHENIHHKPTLADIGGQCSSPEPIFPR